MKLLKRISRWLRLRKRTEPTAQSMHPDRIDRHTRQDIGLDPMASELQRNARLWRDLAA